MMYTYHLSIRPARVNRNEMKRSELFPLIYSANPEAYTNRIFNKCDRLEEKDGDFDNSVYIY
jgi:hypothetical protein